MSFIDVPTKVADPWRDAEAKRATEAPASFGEVFTTSKTEAMYQTSVGKSSLAEAAGSALLVGLPPEQQTWLNARIKQRLQAHGMNKRDRDPLDMAVPDDLNLDYFEMYSDILSEEGAPITQAQFQQAMNAELRRANETARKTAGRSGMGSVNTFATQLAGGVAAASKDPVVQKLSVAGMVAAPILPAMGLSGAAAVATEAIVGALGTLSYQDDVMDLYKQAGIPEQYGLTAAMLAVGADLLLPAAAVGAGKLAGAGAKGAARAGAAVKEGTVKAVNKVSDNIDSLRSAAKAVDTPPEVAVKLNRAADVQAKALVDVADPKDRSVMAPGDIPRQTAQVIRAASEGAVVRPQDLATPPSNFEVAAVNGRLMDSPLPPEATAVDVVEAVSASVREDLNRIISKGEPEDAANLSGKLDALEKRLNIAVREYKEAVKKNKPDIEEKMAARDKAMQKRDMVAKQLADHKVRQQAVKELKALDEKKELPERYAPLVEAELARAKAPPAARAGVNAYPAEPTLEPKEAVEAGQAPTQPDAEARAALEYYRNNPDEVVLDEGEGGTVVRMTGKELADEYDELDAIERAMSRCL